MSDVADVPEVPDELASDEPPRRGRRGVRYGVLGGIVVLAAGAGLYTWTQVKPVVDAKNKYGTITYEVPEAAQLTPADGETVYRIDPTASSLTYEIQEEFAGRDTSTATGVTNGIAGDIAIDPTDLSKTRIEEIVANVEQFHSDNNLRDARLRQDFLESSRYPLITVSDIEIDGLEGELVEGEEQSFTITAAVEVKDETVKTTFDATATLEDGALTATATTTAKLSRFGAGPIRIAGLVSTSDDVELTLELTAYDPTTKTIPTTITGPDAEVADDAPSFAETVQPILEANCVSCHGTGEMGSAHLELATAADARAVSAGLKTVTELRYMPPWPASDAGVPLEHEMKLTDEEIAAIGAWADAGGVLDVPDDTKLEATERPQGPEPRQDVVLEREPYLGSVENTNDYRCFVLDPKFTEPTFMTGSTFLPGGEMVQLHHAQLFHISAEQLADARQRDGADGKPGWECYGAVELDGRGPQATGNQRDDAGFAGQGNLVGGWVPGQSPESFPLNAGVLIQPGEALVLQMHYHFTGEVTPDESTIALQTEPGDSDVKPLRVINPLGPVEIPCAPEDQDEPLCDRDAALRDNVRLYGPAGAANEAGLLILCGQTPESLTKDFDGRRAATTCDHVVPEDGTIVAVLGHMHTLGDSFRLTLDPGEEDEQILLDIPRWSFDWQMNYTLQDPIKVTKGQPLKLECSWDREADPNRAPKYIVFAEGTEDEMCFATYALIPDDPD